MSPTPTFVSRNRYCRHLLGFADIFHAAGLDAPANGDLLGEDLLRQIERMPYRHLALDAAQTLVRLELGRIGSRNRALTRLFSDLVRSIQLEQLLELARELRIASRERGAALGLREDELAYYDAIDVDGSVSKMPSIILATTPRHPMTIRRHWAGLYKPVGKMQERS